MTGRRFPPPWTVEEIPGGFKVIDSTGQSLAYVYSRDNASDALIANVLTTDEARRIASNIASCRDCLKRGFEKWQSPGTFRLCRRMAMQSRTNLYAHVGLRNDSLGVARIRAKPPSQSLSWRAGRKQSNAGLRQRSDLSKRLEVLTNAADELREAEEYADRRNEIAHGNREHWALIPPYMHRRLTTLASSF
jgi:hypothetical protein